MNITAIAARVRSSATPTAAATVICLIPFELFSQTTAIKTLPAEPPATSQPSAILQPSNTTTALQKQLVKVILTTSRPEVTRNHAWGLTADITNISAQTVSIFSNEVQLVMQPEATRNTQCVAAFESFVPNLHKEDGSPAAPLGTDRQITLQPGEHYMFFWSGNDRGADAVALGDCDQGWWGRTKETLNFIPGAYAFTVEGKLHSPDAPSSYHTFAESVSVKLTIEQLAILFFAGLGAILGYLVVALQTDGDIDKMKSADTTQSRVAAVLVFLRRLISAFLTGAILSIVASRLSDTQFPVKVSVNDVWGALTVGFVFFFIGDKIINQIKGLAK